MTVSSKNSRLSIDQALIILKNVGIGAAIFIMILLVLYPVLTQKKSQTISVEKVNENTQSLPPEDYTMLIPDSDKLEVLIQFPQEQVKIKLLDLNLVQFDCLVYGGGLNCALPIVDGLQENTSLLQPQGYTILIPNPGKSKVLMMFGENNIKMQLLGLSSSQLNCLVYGGGLNCFLPTAYHLQENTEGLPPAKYAILIPDQNKMEALIRFSGGKSKLEMRDLSMTQFNCLINGGGLNCLVPKGNNSQAEKIPSQNSMSRIFLEDIVISSENLDTFWTIVLVGVGVFLIHRFKRKND